MLQRWERVVAWVYPKLFFFPPWIPFQPEYPKRIPQCLGFRHSVQGSGPPKYVNMVL